MAFELCSFIQTTIKVIYIYIYIIYFECAGHLGQEDVLIEDGGEGSALGLQMERGERRKRIERREREKGEKKGEKNARCAGEREEVRE